MHCDTMRLKIISAIAIIMAVIALIFVIIPRFGEAKTLTVDDDNPADYSNIQDAVDNASDGDTIRVFDGDYSGGIIINRSLNLQGNGWKTTIIKGRANERTLEINADRVNVSGFRIEGGTCGIFLNSSNLSTIQGNRIWNISGQNGQDGSGKKGGTGAGIFLNFSFNNTVSDNIIELISGGRGGSNETYGDGGNGGIGAGIFLHASGGNNILFNTISNIIGGRGGNNKEGGCSNGGIGSGIYLESSEYNFIENNSISLISGGDGGEGVENVGSGGSGGNAAGIFLRSSTQNFISATTLNNICGGGGNNGGPYGTNGIAGLGFGIYISQDSLENSITPTNLLDYYSIMYFYNQTGITIKGFSLVSAGNPTNLGKIVIINCIDVVIEDNNIMNFQGENSITNRKYGHNKNYGGKDGAGIYISSSDKISIVDNKIQSIKGGQGGPGGAYTPGGIGGMGAGILAYSSNNITIVGNEFISILGGIGGDGGYYRNGGTGGSGVSIYLKDSRFAQISRNICRDISGGKGGKKGYWAHTGASGMSKGIVIESSDQTNISFNNISLLEKDGAKEQKVKSGRKIAIKSVGICIEASENTTVFHNEFVPAGDCGIMINGHTNRTTIERNIIINNKVGVSLEGTENSIISIHFNHIHNNTQFGIMVKDDKENCINATVNWWGSPTGPFHAENNTEGKGDNVTGHVLFKPWLDAPIAPRAFIDSITPAPSLPGEKILFRGHGSCVGIIKRVKWVSSIYGEMYNGLNSSFCAEGLSEGTHLITFEVMDYYGRWSEQAARTLIVHQRPTAEIIEFPADPSIRGELLNFSGRGTDDIEIVRYVWASDIDGELYNGTSPTISLSNLSNGTHTISFRVQDNLGFWSEPISETLTVNGPPRAQIVSIFPNPAVEGMSVTFTGSGTDDGSITRYVWHSDVNGELYNGSETNFSLSNLTPGIHIISFKVQDNLGAWSIPIHLNLKILPPPLKKPTLRIFYSNGSEIYGNVDITGIAFAGSGRIERVEYCVDNESWRPTNGTESWAISLEASKMKNGVHIIRVRAVDSNNLSRQVNLTFVVNNKEEESTPGFTAGILITGAGTGLLTKTLNSQRKRRRCRLC